MMFRPRFEDGLRHAPAPHRHATGGCPESVFACLTIVIHYLCFYRPLTDAVRPWRPAPARSGHAQDTAKTNFHFNLKNAMHL
jgi:hypothetical protein